MSEGTSTSTPAPPVVVNMPTQCNVSAPHHQTLFDNHGRTIVTRPGAGIAPVKSEYLIRNAAIPAVVTDDDGAERKTSHVGGGGVEEEEGMRQAKRQRVDQDGSFNSTVTASTSAPTASTADATEDTAAASADPRSFQARKQTKEEKKSRTGQNKGRRFKSVHDEIRICFSVAEGKVCSFGDKCRMSHDLEGYLKTKEADLKMPQRGDLREEAPFVVIEDPVKGENEKGVEGEERGTGSIDIFTNCPVYDALGHCPQGWKCRYLGGHVRKAEEGTTANAAVDGWILKGDDEEKMKMVQEREMDGEMNFVPGGMMYALKGRRFPYPLSAAYLQEIDPACVPTLYRAPKSQDVKASKSAVATEEMDEEALMNETTTTTTTTTTGSLADLTGAEVDGDDVPTRAVEKRRLDWRGKTYCAPLTTVGNLPFRRLVVQYGADITCGEMGLAQSFIQGGKEEWALTRRHKSEKTFGVQLCGGKPSMMVPAAEAIRKLVHEGEGNGIDFIDVNLGCPIDLVFQRGAGSALFDAPGRLGKILMGMNSVLGDIPLTVKFRTGIKNNVNTAHKFIPRFAKEWGVSGMTLHGRSRQQRYSKLADWSYIKECADVLRNTCTDAGMPTPPIFGNGDCFSAQSYYDEMENTGVDGIMVARGALIKPWIFTEIKERREWDISAVERLDGIRQYAEFGISHWGSDTKGINTTRRFLCEALSFQHRYVPIGLLERLPPQMNERPPAYRGRSELETLLASNDSNDWVKISEMFLGKSPDDFVFNPKHKSNAYGGEEGQG